MLRFSEWILMKAGVQGIRNARAWGWDRSGNGEQKAKVESRVWKACICTVSDRIVAWDYMRTESD